MGIGKYSSRRWFRQAYQLSGQGGSDLRGSGRNHLKLARIGLDLDLELTMVAFWPAWEFPSQVQEYRFIPQLSRNRLHKPLGVCEQFKINGPFQGLLELHDQDIPWNL